MTKIVPNVTFPVRVRDESIGGDNPYRWDVLTTNEMFRDRKVIVFSLPGAFTPTCSTYQLPDFEKLHGEFRDLGIDDIYCVSVNDSFVMNAWARHQNIQNIKVVPDGNGDFTRLMGMLVKKEDVGFGMRSWRYAMLVDDTVILKMWVEPTMHDNRTDDPYGETSPQNILKYLRGE